MQFDVIHLVRIFRPNIGGMETIVENIVLKQIEQKLNVCVITTNFTRDKISDDYVEDFKVIRLNHINIKNNLLPKELPRHITTNILHIHGMDLFVDLISCFISYKKKLLSPHGGFFHTKKLFFLKKIYFNTFSKLLYKGINSYCISYNDVTMTKSLGCISNYMGCGYMTRDVISELKNEIVIFGRIGKNKRVDLSIKFAQDFFENKKINIIGHDEIGLMKNYQFEKNIQYHGLLDDKDFNSVVLNCSYFIFLSEYEGLGMSLIEALDMGLRCIVSNIESFQIIYSQIDFKYKSDFVYFVDNNEKNTNNFEKWKNIQITNEQQIALRNSIRQTFNWNNVIKILNYEL